MGVSIHTTLSLHFQNTLRKSLKETTLIPDCSLSGSLKELEIKRKYGVKQLHEPKYPQYGA
jgi:hypothetical protein